MTSVDERVGAEGTGEARGAGAVGGWDVRRLEAAKVGASAVFIICGMTFATWAGRIPTLREDLGLDPAQLGLLLLCGAAGSLLGLPLAGPLCARFGAGRVSSVAATLCLTALALIGLAAGVAHSVPLTAVLLFLDLLGFGMLDVAMNLEGATVEHHLGRTIMPRYHAGFSLGTVVAALIASGVTAVGVPLVWHFPLAAVVLWVGVQVSIRSFLPAAGQHEEPAARGVPAAGPEEGRPEAVRAEAGRPERARSAWREPRTLLVGLVTLVAAFTEGAANDWLSVAFIDGYRLPGWAGVLGFAVFLAAMTTGRWFGTSWLDRYGRVPVLRLLFVLAGVGSLLVVFGGSAWPAFLGAAAWGLGVSLGFPVGMSAAADDPARAAVRLSVVSTIAYGAFLAGPPLLGALGSHVGVLRSLVVVSALLVPALLATPAMRRP